MSGRPKGLQVKKPSINLEPINVDSKFGILMNNVNVFSEHVLMSKTQSTKSLLTADT